MNSKCKGLCKGLASTVLVLGIIGSIILAVVCGEVRDVSYSLYSGMSTSSERNGVLTFAILVSGLLGTGVLYAILAGLGEVLEYLEMLSKGKEKDSPEKVEADEELPPL